MTADSPRDYSPETQPASEDIANALQILGPATGNGARYGNVEGTPGFWVWAPTVGDACRLLASAQRHATAKEREATRLRLLLQEVVFCAQRITISSETSAAIAAELSRALIEATKELGWATLETAKGSVGRTLEDEKASQRP